MNDYIFNRGKYRGKKKNNNTPYNPPNNKKKKDIMKLIDLVCNFIALILGMFSSIIMCLMEYRWVTDASMQHTGIKWAGGLLCIVCVLFVYLCVKELVSTINGKE